MGKIVSGYEYVGVVDKSITGFLTPLYVFKPIYISDNLIFGGM